MSLQRREDSVLRAGVPSRVPWDPWGYESHKPLRGFGERDAGASELLKNCRSRFQHVENTCAGSTHST